MSKIELETKTLVEATWTVLLIPFIYADAEIREYYGRDYIPFVSRFDFSTPTTEPSGTLQ